ncbi:MAG: hypothetical protein M1827_004136 [Pycnora praestabilis]|nr:MAG: hypothetical protein M1827_004136 [Pycnora praestabilis]
MQASPSLVKTALRIPGQPAATGVLKSRPFFNVWTSENEQKKHRQSRRMSSATKVSPDTKTSSPTNFFSFSPPNQKGKPSPLTQLKGRVVLVVNTASKCGFTPQFDGLEAIHKSLAQKYPNDFVLLGFPCNQFMNQDPGTQEEIEQFCRFNYGVSFTMMGKTDVNGPTAEPVWEWMKSEKPGLFGMKRIKWNFEKFLISADGRVVERWASLTKPETLEKIIIEEIEKGKRQAGAKSAKKPSEEYPPEKAEM